MRNGKPVSNEEYIARGKALYATLKRPLQHRDLRGCMSTAQVGYRFGGIDGFNEACGIAPAPLDFAGVRAAQAKTRDNSALRHENRLLHAEMDRLIAEQAELRGLRSPVEPRVIRPTKARDGKPTILGGPVLASDWHVGALVAPAVVNDMNSYNAEIAEESAHNFFRKVLTLINIERSVAHIDELLLWLGGDFINNTIHEDLAESNTMSPVEEVRFAKRLWIEGLTYLLAEGDFKRIILPCSFGNHGRTTDKRRIQTAGENSYERMMYQDLQDWFDARSDKRLDWRIAAGEHVYVDVACPGKRVFTFDFFHGDTIRGGMGVGGLAVPAGRRILKLERQRHANLRCFGHFHTLGWDDGSLRNGSLVGFDAFAESIGAPLTHPCQAFSTFNPERFTVDAVKPIWVRGKRKC